MSRVRASPHWRRREARQFGLPVHYDLYVRPWPEERPGSVIRQRMDFLLLLPQCRRILLEVDGRHHYATDNGTADARQFARMLAELRPR